MILKKTFSKLGIKGNFLNLIKIIYKKSTANIVHEAKKLKAFTKDQVQGKDIVSHHSFSTSYWTF